MRFLKTVLCLLGLVGTVLAGPSSSRVTSQNVNEEFARLAYKPKFDSFKSQFGVSYESEEMENYRFGVFVNNMQTVDKLNNAGDEATYGVTRFSDMEPAEFKRQYMGYKPKFGQEGLNRLSHEVTKPAFAIDPNADNVDWTAKGAVTAVKDQASCGSCWAFSTAEEVESMWFLKHGTLPVLSEQQIVSCDTKSDAGCNGGDTVTAYAYVQSNGLETEKAYPYTGTDSACKFNSTAVTSKISGYTYATPSCFDSCASQDEATLLNNLASTGPVSICVYAETWQFYVSGVLSSSCPKAYSTLDHCVQLTGYQAASTPYWVIRNSWGTSWGNAGYIYVKYGSNMCGIADEATFATSA